jgi:hypothetical protein
MIPKVEERRDRCPAALAVEPSIERAVDGARSAVGVAIDGTRRRPRW